MIQIKIGDALKTNKSMRSTCNLLTRQINLLDSLTGDIEAMKIVKGITEEMRKTISYLTSNKICTYSFEAGGWNTCNAATIEEAIEIETKRWDGKENLAMKLDSFRLDDFEETKKLMLNFY